MDHKNQSGNGGWLGSRRSLVLIAFSRDYWVSPFHGTSGAPVRHSSLTASASVPVHALLHAWRSRQTRQRARDNELRAVSARRVAPIVQNGNLTTDAQRREINPLAKEMRWQQKTNATTSQ